MPRRVVISSAAVLSSAGRGIDALTANVRTGVCSLAPDERLRVLGTRAHLSGQLPDVDAAFDELRIEPSNRALFGRFSRIGAVTAFDALATSGGTTPPAIGRVLVATAVGPMGELESCFRDTLLHDRHPLPTHAVTRVTPSFLATYLAGAVGAPRGGRVVSCACVSALEALRDAVELIASGTEDACLVGAVDEDSASTYWAFDAQRLLGQAKVSSGRTRALSGRPGGFVPAGGAAFFVLEAEETALASGRSPDVSIAGVTVRSEPQPASLIAFPAAAYRAALDDVRASHGSAFDLILAHAPPTVADVDELRLLDEAFDLAALRYGGAVVQVALRLRARRGGRHRRRAGPDRDRARRGPPQRRVRAGAARAPLRSSARRSDAAAKDHARAQDRVRAGRRRGGDRAGEDPMIVHDALGRATDIAQVALGNGLLRPLFRWLRAARPDLVERMRHEPFAARGETFVRAVGPLEKAAFFAKMLGTDGGWAERTPPERCARSGEGTDWSTEEMLFAGDVLFPGALDERSLSAPLRARIASAACFVLNLEGTLADRAHELAPLLTRRGLGQLLAYVADPTNTDWVSRLDPAGLQALLGDAARAFVCVANNHTLDDGADGFETTLELLDRAGIGVVGDARRNEGAELALLGPHRVGLFAIAYGSNRAVDTLPHRSTRHLSFDDVPYRLTRERIEALTRGLRARGATHVVALLHWGHEHEHEPTSAQRRCAEVLFEAGVSAVIGHHPHLMQPSEGGGGRWVSYSLGDFVGGDRTIWSRFSAMVALRFGAGGAVLGEVIPVVQAPSWKRHQTMLLAEAPAFERAVFDRWFRAKLPPCPRVVS